MIVRCVLLCGLVIWGALSAPSVLAQSGRKPEAPPSSNTLPFPNANPSQDDVISRVRTNEIVLPVTVRNDYGRLSTDLSARDFIIVEDGTRQEITSFNTQRVPLKVVLLLDVSGSVFSEMEAIRKASIEFVRQLSPEDEVAVIQFGKSVELLQNWTSDRAKIERAINWEYRATQANFTETHLWDGMFLAADELLPKVEGRRTILLLTDCDDNGSRVTDAQALGAVVRSNSSLYVISKARAIAEDIKQKYGGKRGAIAGTRSQANALYNRFIEDEARMSQLSERSGGKLFNAMTSEDLTTAYRQVCEELQSQYVLTYISSNETPKSTFRKISVIVTRPGMKASWREGYYLGRDYTILQ